MDSAFRIDDWLPKREPVKQSPISDQGDFSIIRDRIVAQRIDITGDYEQWLNLGFALSYDLGEDGRQIYHDISQFHPDYKPDECDKQYTYCLNAKGSSKITGRTFFEIAKKCGIDIRTAPPKIRKSVDSVSPQPAVSAAQPPGQPPYLPAPSFSDEVFLALPEFLQKVAIKGSNEREQDILILSAIGVISAMMPKVFGVYDDVTIYPNLFFYITGMASAGKGGIRQVRRIAEPAHEELRKQYDADRSDYDRKLAEYERDKHKKNAEIPEKPEKPRQRMLIIPGNTSATAVIQIMHDNDGACLIVESEGDTLARAFSSDYGNYSENFRCSFHHEPFGYHRRGGDEHVEVKEPKLSAVLTGTPEQIKSLIPSPENGLFSRFGFYYLESILPFKNVFKRSGEVSKDKYFEQLGQEYLEFFHSLQKAEPLEFTLTEPQQDIFLDFFSEKSTDMFIDFGEGILATIRRLGVICFRVSMVLSTLRLMESGNFYENIVCTDEDFNTAMTISKALLQHSTKVFCELFGEKQRPRLSSSDEQRLLDALPEEFGRKDYVAAAMSLNINPRTAEGYVSKFCGKIGLVEHVGYDKYRKKS